MPTAHIEIRNERNRWVAIVEAGGITARCRTVFDDTFDGIMLKVQSTYRELTGMQMITEHGAPEPASTAGPPSVAAPTDDPTREQRAPKHEPGLSAAGPGAKPLAAQPSGKRTKSREKFLKTPKGSRRAQRDAAVAEAARRGESDADIARERAAGRLPALEAAR